MSAAVPAARPPSGRHDVVTFGEALAVFLAPVAVPLGAADRFDLTYAGAETNVAVGLVRLGHSCAFLGRVGDDAFGHRIAAALRGEGVDARLVFDARRPTGLLVRDVLVGRPISVQYHRAGSAASVLAAGDLDLDVIRSARVLHVTGVTAALSDSAFAACGHAMDAARDAGVHVVFDPNVRTRLAAADTWTRIVTDLGARADTVLCGTDDARVALGDIAAADVPDYFHHLGAKIVIVKDGSNGAFESSDGAVLHQGARAVPAVDAVGAGDAFAAGWLSGWLRGVDPAQRLLEAATVAACAVMAPGDIAGLPDARTCDAMLTSTSDVLR